MQLPHNMSTYLKVLGVGVAAGYAILQWKRRADHAPENRSEREIDHTVEDSFPASDPPPF